MTQWSDSVQKLIELTRAGMLEWQKDTGTFAYGAFSRENVVGLPYFAEFRGQHLALYETRFQTVDDEERPYWKHVAIVEFVTSKGELELTWPVQVESRDLLQAVRVRTSGAKEFLDALLSTEIPKSKPEKK